MCSYQNISDANHGNLPSENWEEDFWANLLSPNTSDLSSNQDSETSTIQGVSANGIATTTIGDYQVQISTAYQNVESSSLLSPTWEDSAFDIPQTSTNMSTYFSTFDPSSQFQRIPINQSQIARISPMNLGTQNTNGNGKIHRARISLVSAGNGTYKAIVKRKRKRTVFTTEQLEVLEEVFSKKPYVTRDERQLLVKKLQVNDKSIKVWFQNRRIKNKRGDEQDEVMQDDSNCKIFERLDIVESKMMKRTNEFGYVTLDDKIMNDLVTVIDDYFSNVPNVETRTEIDSSPIYEPISPASTTDYSCEENSSSCHYYEPNNSVQELIDIDSIIST